MKVQTFIFLGITFLFNIAFSQYYDKQASVVSNTNGKVTLLQEGSFFTLNNQIVTVKLQDNKTIPSDIKVIRANILGYYDIEVPNNISYEDYMKYLKSLQLFSVIEYNAIGKYNEEIKSNDSSIDKQWYLSRINIFNAWKFSFGDENIKIGVLDSGLDWAHKDIGLGRDSYQNVYLNPNEDLWKDNNNPSTGDYIDNDRNGFIDDLKGWNFITQSNDVRTTNSHGTQVSGIISAKTNNAEGIAGIVGGNKKKGVQVIPVCVGIFAPESSILDDAIIYAVNSGVRIIQLSLSVLKTDAIEKAIDYAKQKNVLIICASGNDSSNNLSYPSSNEYVIAVGGIDRNNRRAPFSNYGNNLSVVAPGIDIFSTGLNNTYLSSDGTSFAAPQVSGVAALILSVNPDLTVKQVADIIEQTAQKVGGYNYQNTYTRPNGTWNNEMGYGLVDAYKALQKATIAGPDEFCLRTDATFELIAPIPNDATIKWEDPEYRLEIVSGQGTKSCVFRGTYWDGNRTIKAVVTYKDGTVKSFEKEVYVRYQGNWANAQYTIKNHPQSPYSTPCCNGSTRVIKHVILDDYMGGASIKVEWKNTIVYKDPKDKFEFRGTNREEEFVATRYTFTPFIVETKMRYISDCGTPTKWSNTIARYYGAINETSFRSASAYNSPVKSTNEDIPVYEFFTNRTSTLRVQTEDLQQWLDAKYSGKELNDKELQKVLYYLNNRDNLDKIGVKVFDFSGKRILQGDLDFGKSLDFNMSRYAKGFYIIIYEFGSISNGKVIYKP
ncbi:S8 family serine peptidase [Capnocytophaga sp. oral taxon 380]|uniref:S8 family serine peptidase n=1 Tax=Capnocytophaga sp. oral taxon 380 TaxID=712217 RepID=UPI0002A22D40|nr:S8 family serine peptidase [Capnocytophaga sp. oral taxon 380]EKY06831.1 peptidase, S8/S53 family [Capnocytophaga sp. oral taxon 380 str. F0488]